MVKIGEFYTSIVEDEVRDIFKLSSTKKGKFHVLACTRLCVRMGRNGFGCVTRGELTVAGVKFIRTSTKEEIEFYEKCVTAKGFFIE